MRAFLPAFVALIAPLSAQLVVPLDLGSPSAVYTFNHNQARIMDPAGPGLAIPPPSSEGPASPSGPGGNVMLSDVMGRDRSINLFAGFVRDIESASRRLEDSSQNTTVLAPLNLAVEKLPQKPWEDPREYGALGPDAYDGGEGRERAQRNLRRFVEAHLVPLSPWPEGKKVRPLGGDRDIWWEEKDGIRVIHPDAIEVTGTAGMVANGEVWIIEGVRNSS